MISVEVMKTIDDREMQKTKEKQTKAEKKQGEQKL